VVLTFDEPFVPWQATLWRGVLPEHILRPVYEADGTLDNAEWNRAPTVGIGPFVFKEWETGSHFSFTPNPNYYGI
jgi:peptide/nickel transport system substrate-binding protein